MRWSAALLAAVIACGPRPGPADAGPLELDGGAPDSGPSGEDGGATGLAQLVARAVGDGGFTVDFPSGRETVDQLPAVVLGRLTPSGVEVVAVSRPGAPTLTRTTVLPLSSISKAVTGLLAARDVVEGRFTATTPVSTLLASDLSPLVGDRTVVELVSHTGGYLPNPQDLDVTTRPNEPAAAYTRERLARCLGRPPCSVGGAMRGTYLYSNLGSGLLGVAIADARDGGSEALLQERLAGPLGLVDTHLREASDLSRTVPGTTPTGETVGPASMGVLAGAGELLSTTDDQLKLLAVLLDPPADWRPVVELATSPTTSTGAIAWGIDRVRVDGRLVFSKTGEQAGYSSIILWSQSEGVGVVAFTPVGRSSRTLAGLALEVLQETRGP